VRLFVALDLDTTIRSAAATLSGALRARALEQAPRARLTWVAPERLHITLVFIGALEAERAAAVTAVLAPPLASPPFIVEAGGVGAFPARGRPRVLWAGVGRGSGQLAAIATDVQHRLSSAGVTVEERPLTPHLTLARVRDGIGLHPARLFAGFEDTPLGEMTVSAITLFESRLSPAGPQYQVVQQIAVTGEGAQ
jgi:2'-5' RNA ligase